jgi:hypothetical protein
MIAASLLQGLAGFAIYFCIATSLLRTCGAGEPASVVILGAPICWLIALVVLLAAGQTVNFWLFSASYGFLVLAFLMAFGALYKSISLRILRDLARKPDHADLYEHVLARYIVAESFDNRLTVIQNKQFAVREGERYTLTPRGRRIAKLLRTVQRAFGILQSG